MNAAAAPLAIDLPARWTGHFRLTQTPGGVYVGMATLSLGGVEQCVLVITQQQTFDTAMARIKLRAGQYIKAWNAGPQTGPQSLNK